MNMTNKFLAAVLIASAITPAQAAFQDYVGTDVTYQIDWSKSWLTGLTASLNGNTLMFSKADGSSMASLASAGNGDLSKREQPVNMYSWITVRANQGKQISDIHAQQTADIKVSGPVGKLDNNPGNPSIWSDVTTTVGVLTPGNGSGWQWVGYSTFSDVKSLQTVPFGGSNKVVAMTNSFSYGDSLIENGAVIPQSPWLNLSFDSVLSIYGSNFANRPNTFANLALNGIGVTVDTVTAPVPEPETYALMGIGLVGLCVARRRKTHN